MSFLRFTRITLLLFAVSVALGAIFAGIFLRHNRWTSNVSKISKLLETPHDVSYAAFLHSKGLKQMHKGGPRSTIALENSVIVDESKYLKEAIPVLCWVMLKTDPIPVQVWPYLPSLMSAGQAIKDTWGKRCKDVVYFTSQRRAHDPSEAVVLKTKDLSSWSAHHEAFKYLFEHKSLATYEWTIKLEQDSYLILENLLYYLSVYNASRPYYMGHAYQQWGRSFNVDGPGTVLSRAAMALIRTAFSKGHCPPQNLNAAAALAQCLAEQGVQPEDTRDREGRARFLMYQPETLLVPGNLPWSETFWMHTKYISNEEDIEKPSRTPVTNEATQGGLCSAGVMHEPWRVSPDKHKTPILASFITD